MTSRLLIRKAFVITMDERLGDLRNADILVEDDRLAAVGPDLAVDDALTIDAAGMIALPGFVDTHRHTWQCLLRNTAVDWSLGQYFAGVRTVIGDHVTADDIYVANYGGAVEALDAGITTLYDWSHCNNTPEHADAGVQALFDAGLRAVYGYGNANREWIPVSDLPTDFDDIRRVRRRYFASEDQRVTMAFAARGPQYTTLPVAEADFRAGRELGLRITVHAGSGLWGTRRPVGALAERGLLYPETVYVHACTLADDELELIAGSGGFVSCSPEVELNMGHGWPATLRARRFGLAPTLSIDVTTSVGGDMFSAMRAMMAAARAQHNATLLEAREIADRPVVTSRDILRFATIEGARACGLADRTGSITPGKKADLVLISTDSPSMFPLNYPVGAVVEAGHPGRVDTVIVDGQVRKRRGCLVDIDLPSLAARMHAARDALFERAGIPSDGSWFPIPHIGGALDRPFDLAAVESPPRAGRT
jgi:5-methylthioadenosine/S-adenosylhomocysteine deaminase